MITGGAGFIGSHLVDALLRRGVDVCVVDDFSTGKESNLGSALRGGAVVVRADVRESEHVAEAVVSCGPEVIFHLAAQMNVRDSVADPASTRVRTSRARLTCSRRRVRLLLG